MKNILLPHMYQGGLLVKYKSVQYLGLENLTSYVSNGISHKQELIIKVNTKIKISIK